MRPFLSIALTLLLIVGIPAWAHALTVSPAKIEIIADPGQVVQGEIELFNEQPETKVFYTSYENFESRGDSGAPYFTGGKTGLATWFETKDSITIASGERMIVPYTLRIPAGAKPGGYFAAIFFGSQPPVGTEGGEVTIGGKIGVLVLLRVAGDVEESAGLGSFGTKGSRFVSTLPVTFEYAFNNTGGDRVVPRGEIKIRNTVQLVSARLVANENEGSVLPSSTRRFETTWGSERESKGFFRTALYQLTHFHIGWYSAKLSLTWGASAQMATDTHHFFVIPWQLLSIILGLGALGRWGVKRWMRALKQRILAEASKTNS